MLYILDRYVEVGDHIALQYGGSEAHKKVTTERSESIAGPIGKVCNMRYTLETMYIRDLLIVLLCD